MPPMLQISLGLAIWIFYLDSDFENKLYYFFFTFPMSLKSSFDFFSTLPVILAYSFSCQVGQLLSFLWSSLLLFWVFYTHINHSDIFLGIT